MGSSVLGKSSVECGWLDIGSFERAGMLQSAVHNNVLAKRQQKSVVHSRLPEWILELESKKLDCGQQLGFRGAIKTDAESGS